jgi:hypothetical protein
MRKHYESICIKKKLSEKMKTPPTYQNNKTDEKDIRDKFRSLLEPWRCDLKLCSIFVHFSH